MYVGEFQAISLGFFCCCFGFAVEGLRKTSCSRKIRIRFKTLLNNFKSVHNVQDQQSILEAYASKIHAIWSLHIHYHKLSTYYRLISKYCFTKKHFQQKLK